MSRNNSGKWAEDNFKKSLSNQDVVLLRWPDYRDFITVQCPKCRQVFHSKYQAPKAPADFVILYKDRYSFVEIKSCAENASYVYRSGREYYIKPHQMEYGLQFNEMGGRYFFLLYNEKKNVYLMDPKKFLYLMDANDLLERTRIKWEDVEEKCEIKLEVGTKKKVFDGKKLIEAIFNGEK